jgi:hypothetical protein
MKKLTLRLLAVILSVCLAGSIYPLFAQQHTPGEGGPAHTPGQPPGGTPSAGPPAPTPPPIAGGTAQLDTKFGASQGVLPSLDSGGCGGGGCDTAPPPATPKPTGYLSDGRPYYGSGTSADPYRDYSNLGQSAGGITFGTIPVPPPPPKTTEETKIPEAGKAPKVPETHKTPPREPTRLEILNKSWDFWQSQYKSWENDRVAPVDQCLRNMADAKQHLDNLQKDFATMGKTPPTANPSATQYPPQTADQTKAMNNYQNYLKAMDELRRAHGTQIDVRQKTGLDALTGERNPAIVQGNRWATEKAERDVAQAQTRVDQLQTHWQDSGNQVKYGSLPDKKTTVPDPTYTPKDPRKPQRTVDPMEHKIKSTP